MTREDLLARILYRDDDVIVIDKPAGLAVHAAGKITNHLDLYLPWLVDQEGDERIPALAHRLDRDTAGCLVLGRHDRALKRLGKLFADGLVRKTYWAVVEGIPDQPAGIINQPLLKLPRTGGFSIIPDPAGKPALSSFRVCGTDPVGRRSWLELIPHTGRTHQLRLHCAVLGCPIVNEPFYGAVKGVSGLGDLHLFSRTIGFQLASSTPRVQVTAPVPSHVRSALAACGWTDKDADDRITIAGEGDEVPPAPALPAAPPGFRPD